MRELLLTKRELAYLRHKAWHYRPTWYWYIKARAVSRGDLFGTTDYVFMSGMELEYVTAILSAYRPEFT